MKQIPLIERLQKKSSPVDAESVGELFCSGGAGQPELTLRNQAIDRIIL